MPGEPSGKIKKKKPWRLRKQDYWGKKREKKGLSLKEKLELLVEHLGERPFLISFGREASSGKGGIEESWRGRHQEKIRNFLS